MPFKFKGEMLRNAMRLRWMQHVRERGPWRGKRKLKPRQAASWR